MARTKSDVRKNIRNTITGSSSSMDYKGEVGKNIELSKTLHGVSTFLETLSKNEHDLFKKLIDAVEEIPKNNDELQRQQKIIFDNLIKTTALMKKAAETEKDPEKKQELESAASNMMDRGTSIQKNMDTNPRGLREMIGSKKYGIDPREVREKGLVRSVFSQAKREVFGGKYEPKFSDIVEKQQQVLPTAESTDLAPSSSAIEVPKKEKSLTEKTKGNLASLNVTNAVLKSILSEVKDIKKNLGKKSDKPSDKPSNKLLDKPSNKPLDKLSAKPSIKLSKKEKEAQKWRDVEKFSIRDYYDRKQKEENSNKLRDVSKIDQNPNKLRDVSKIDQNPFDEARYTGSDIDKDTEQKPVQGSVEEKDGGPMLPTLPIPPIPPVPKGVFSRLRNLIKRGKVPARAAGAASSAEGGVARAAKGGGAASSAEGGVARAATGSIDDVAKGASRASKVFKGAGRLLGRAATPLTIAAGAYEGYTGYQDAKKLEESGKITKEEATRKKGEAIGGATAGTGGALAGAAVGATVGSVVPVVGTAIGGLVGGLIGWYGGKAAGSAAGGAIATSMASSPPSLANPKSPTAAIATIQSKTRAAGMNALNNQTQPTVQQPPAPMITNITNSSPAQAVKSTPNNPTLPAIRTSDNSFLRYQDRRMTRIL